MEPKPTLLAPPEKLPALSIDWLNQESVNIDEENKTRVDPSVKRSTTEVSKSLTLEKCLDLFCNSEQLGPTEAWYCPKCKAHRQAFKRMELWNAPDYLVIHLKRFAVFQSLRNKIDTLVEFPVEGLNLGPLLQGGVPPAGAIYDLYAISNHMGGLGGGHYTAHVKSTIGAWFLMNDNSYQPVRDVREMQTSNAYLLFYARRQPAAPVAAAAAPAASAPAEANDETSTPKRRRGDD